MTLKPPAEFASLHEKCGTVTSVGGSIVSNMHADPYFYAPHTTICANCGEVPDAHFTIVESGEKLDAYCKRLRQAKGPAYHVVRWGIYVVCMVVGAVVTPLITANAKGQIPQPWNSLFGALMGGLVAMFIGRYVRLLLCKVGVI
jgi:hypothetical protein